MSTLTFYVLRFSAAITLAAALLMPVPPAQAQSDGAAHLRSPGVYRDTLDAQRIQPFALRPFILTGSARAWLDGARLDTARYRLDARHGRLWIPRVPEEAVRLVVAYRTFPFRFEPVYRRRIASLEDSTGAQVVKEEQEAEGARGDPFAELTMERSGSISRGVIAGSGRDLGIESGLRMQLSGEIAEDVRIHAALTDANTPIQPAGTTRRLRDFDRVFIEIDAPQGTARLGDVDLALTGTAFARLERKLQGVTVRSRSAGSAGGGWGGGQLTVAGAVARGTYRSQEIDPIDGVQGPYRLRGASGELFVVVIAGSETVYLDGERLMRGEANDYVIDYATGEITFTPHRLITSDDRIRVEYEYAARPYTRTFLAAQGETSFWRQEDGTARASIGATFIREADSRRFDAAIALSPEDSLRLVRSGDERASRSGAERVPFDPQAPYVQYTREVRPLPGGGVDTAFVALEEAPPEGAPVYRVRFTRVGAGQGRYEREGRAVNGIVYVYRGPGQGAYAPRLPLPQPKQQRMIDLHGRLEVLPGVEVFGEWARSLNDRNRFSPLDAANDHGMAYVAGARLDSVALEVGRVSLGALSAEVRRQLRSDHFASFVRTRPVEFERRWNLSARPVDPAGGIAGGGDEVITEAELAWAFTPAVRLRGVLGRLRLGEQFESRRHVLSFTSEKEGLPRGRYRLAYITSADAARSVDGAWLRQQAALRQPFWDGRMVPRLEVEHERRLQRALGTDSLGAPSFAFVEYRPGLTYRAGDLSVGGSFEWRAEQQDLGGRLRDASTAWTLLADLEYAPGNTFDTEARVGLRNLHINDAFKVEEGRQGGASVVIRSQTHYRPFERAVVIEGFYEALTERTPTLQEIYVRVGPERGQYVWQDLDGDGLVQVDEFLPERTPNEGTYAQTFVPSDSLRSVISVQARLRLRLDPRRRWRAAEARWKRWLARVQAQTVLEVQETSRTPELAQIYLLNLRRFRDPATTQRGRLRIAQDVSLFRLNPRYGVDLSFSQTRSLHDRAAGAERRLLTAWGAEGRYKPAPAWTLELAGGYRTNRSRSPFASRTYAIRSTDLRPEVTFSPPQLPVQVSGSIALSAKRDAVQSRQARLVRLPLTVRYRRAGRFQLTARGEVAHVRLEGDAAGLARFELTDGRGPGTSLRWGLSGQAALSSTLRATLAYDGRAFADAPVLNTLRMSLSATF